MSTLNQLETCTRMAFDRGYLEDALIHSSCLIEELRKQTVSALEMRAAIWQRKNKLSQELNDELLIIKYDGGDINTHIRVAKLYSIQGKQQDAIDMLERALYISPDNEQEESIQQQITLAKARLDRRIDFITRAPFEIASNIVGRIGCNHQIKEPLNVSKGWREVILQCPQPWESSINTLYSCDWFWGTPAVFHKLLPLVSHHVKDLVVYSHHTTTFNEFFHTCNFSRLQCLEIIRMFDEDHESLGAPLYQALRQLPVLKNLNIQAVITVQLGQLLSSCLGLTSLILRVRDITDWDTGLPSTTPLKTIKISTRMTARPVTAENMESLLRRTPDLRHLRLHPRLDDILSVIKDKCPKLSTLINHPTWEGYCIPYEMREIEERPGLQQVLFDNIRSAIPLTQRLEKHSSIMRKLHLVLFNGGRDSALSDWHPLSSSVMPNMTYLGIKADLNSAIFRHLPIMLRAYPALKALYLCGTEESGDVPVETADKIFDTVNELTNLTNLNLLSIPAKGQGLERLIRRYMNQEQPTLKELGLAYCHMDPILLHSVAKIKSLRHLLVRMDDVDGISISDIVEFSRLIAQLPELTDLDLYDMHLTQKAAEYIGGSQSLERLELIDFGQTLDDDAYENVQHLFAHIPI
ncbi:hypothetical protein BJV82DRAFT_316055 [Fennellomyces sp. T-0311]|nr:hypothetical protein BJV82DRAFT_316055 [Fennellomyces sp. T-0311]